MKNNLLSLIFFLLYSSLNAQIAIGKSNVDGTSTLLDFGEANRGIVLSAVSSENLPNLTSNNNGTFLYDMKSQTVQMYENQTWKPLTDQGDSTEMIINNYAEIGDGVIVGSNATEAIGVLVLESDDQALILPKVSNPHLNIKNPHPGTICYDVESKSLAVFDGLNWNFWK